MEGREGKGEERIEEGKGRKEREKKCSIPPPTFE